MPDTPSITIVKEFDYRGLRERWSNTYHFSGTTPGNDAAWKTLADALAAQEKTLFTSDCKIVGALGYEAGNNNSVAQIDYTAAPLTPISGTASVFPNQQVAPGDVAAWVRWRTPDRNSAGKWIYLRKYFHDCIIPAGQETLAPDQKTAYIAYAAKMTDGSLPGGFKVCGPQGAVAGAATVSPFVTTRTLKRRGKRP